MHSASSKIGAKLFYGQSLVMTCFKSENIKGKGFPVLNQVPHYEDASCL
jgi:hypothetical protein